MFKIILSLFLKLYGKNKLIKFVKLFPLTIKSIIPMQKLPHIIESYGCIL